MRVKLMVFLLMMVCVSNVYAESEYNIESLRGLKGVLVILEKLTEDIEKDGLSRSSIQTDVELKLRLAGIKIFTVEEWHKEPGRPFLSVYVNSIKPDNDLSRILNIHNLFHIFHIEVRLHQFVLVSRNNTLFGAPTWETSSLGLAGTKNLSFIRDKIKDLVDEFINDYLSVNPKE